MLHQILSKFCPLSYNKSSDQIQSFFDNIPRLQVSITGLDQVSGSAISLPDDLLHGLGTLQKTDRSQDCSKLAGWPLKVLVSLLLINDYPTAVNSVVGNCYLLDFIYIINRGKSEYTVTTRATVHCSPWKRPVHMISSWNYSQFLIWFDGAFAVRTHWHCYSNSWLQVSSIYCFVIVLWWLWLSRWYT